MRPWPQYMIEAHRNRRARTGLDADAMTLPPEPASTADEVRRESIEQGAQEAARYVTARWAEPEVWRRAAKLLDAHAELAIRDAERKKVERLTDAAHAALASLPEGDAA